MVLIYFVEEDPDYAPLVRAIFELLDGGQLLGCSSVLTLLEVLVQPLRAGRMARPPRSPANEP